MTASWGRRRVGNLCVGVALALAAGCSGYDDSEPSSAAPPESSAEPTPSTTTTTADVTTPTGRFVREACAGDESDPARVTCGHLEVPERHADPEGRQIDVEVRIIGPAEPTGPDAVPIAFLAGGPGYGSVNGVQSVLDDPRARRRTTVLIDYRGVGASDPSLACHENDDLPLAQLAVAADDPRMQEQWLDALRACRARLVADDVDIAAYNYTEIAADLDALREALGFEQWDLWGLSNGGRVALETVRRYPDGVRSLVLDAPGAPQGNLFGELWPYGEDAMEHLFDACAADAGCDEAFPDLRASAEGLVRRLGRSPVEIEVPNPAGPGRVPVLLTDALALEALRQSLYDVELVPLLPFYIDALARGRSYDEVGGLIASRTGGEGFSDGMSMSVTCQEEIAFLPEGYFEEQAEQLSLAAPGLKNQDWVAECAAWDVGKADDVIDEPVTSDVPALILVGEFDPVHPVAASREIAAGLPSSTVVELPGLAHGTIGAHPCADRIMSAFLADPTATVDTSCVDRMPEVPWLLS